jgi:hypothetical protein
MLVGKELERLQFEHDTTTALKVVFGDETSYGDFMYVLNLALIYQVKRYALVDNEFYFFINPPPAPPPVELKTISL